MILNLSDSLKNRAKLLLSSLPHCPHCIMMILNLSSLNHLAKPLLSSWQNCPHCNMMHFKFVKFKKPSKIAVVLIAGQFKKPSKTAVVLIASVSLISHYSDAPGTSSCHLVPKHLRAKRGPVVLSNASPPVLRPALLMAPTYRPQRQMTITKRPPSEPSDYS